MRKLIAIAILGLLSSLGAAAPVAATASGVKVVIIVGPTEGTTASYRHDADSAYAEAIKYTSNVVKVYSPNATWAKVKAAAVGASIVLYFGHGNGWPSPYGNDAAYTTKDGFGLNATAGNGDSNHTYYGEPFVSTLALAPNAVVILGHLCYASGNSESGKVEGTVSVAHQRVDNFAAGFMKAGARAVIAEGHGGPEPYIRALFTTHSTILGVWQSAPNNHGHQVAFASTRTPGATAYTDTDTTTGGYYRSLVAKPGLTSDMVTGAAYADTGVDPVTLVVPGNASVGSAAVPIYGSDGQPNGGTIPADARLRVVPPQNAISAVVTGAPLVHVEGIDDGSIDGWVATTDLIPRDSTAPQAWGVDTGVGVVSPNGDARSDTITVSARWSETVTWRAQILDGSTVVGQATGSGTQSSLTWDGTHGGNPLPDGTYTYRFTGNDAWDNGPSTTTGTVAIDTTPAQLGTVAPAADLQPWFSPNGDASRDTVAWSAAMTEPGSLIVHVEDSVGTRIRWLSVPASTGSNAVIWDGKDDAGHVVPDGVYTVRIWPRDVAGNQGDPQVRTVLVDTTLGSVTTSKTIFFPQDGDTLAPATALGFSLARPATVTWTIRNAAGAIVDTLIDAQPTAAGRISRTWYGWRTTGPRLPLGSYTSVVTATDDVTTMTQAVAFQMNAFGITASDTTPARGQTITVHAVSAESLKTTPRLYITQPGRTTWSVAMHRISGGVWSVTIRLRTGGSAGAVKLKVVATDTLGHKQRTTLVVIGH